MARRQQPQPRAQSALPPQLAAVHRAAPPARGARAARGGPSAGTGSWRVVCGPWARRAARWRVSGTSPNNPVERTAYSAGVFPVRESAACGPPLTGSVRLLALYNPTMSL
jgi:hypothetical protein